MRKVDFQAAIVAKLMIGPDVQRWASIEMEWNRAYRELLGVVEAMPDDFVFHSAGAEEMLKNPFWGTWDCPRPRGYGG